MKDDAYAQASSPVVVAHQSFAGLGVILSDSAATLTVKAGGEQGGPFPITLTMEGTDEYRYPDTTSMNIAYNAAFLEITWTSGTMRLFQKG
jgi:hypothetical protein